MSSHPAPTPPLSARLRGWFKSHRIYILLALAILAVVFGSIPWGHSGAYAGAAMENASGGSPRAAAQQTPTVTARVYAVSASTDLVVLGAGLLVLIIGISGVTALLQHRKE